MGREARARAHLTPIERQDRLLERVARGIGNLEHFEWALGQMPAAARRRAILVMDQHLAFNLSHADRTRLIFEARKADGSWKPNAGGRGGVAEALDAAAARPAALDLERFEAEGGPPID